MMVKACKIKTEGWSKGLLSSSSLRPSLHSQNSNDNNIYLLEFLHKPNKLSTYTEQRVIQQLGARDKESVAKQEQK